MPEQKNEKNDDWSKEIPECPDIKTPEKTLPRTSKEVTKMSFSDDDEDMNVDFDVDIDDDDVGNLTADLEDEAMRDDDGSKKKEADSSTFNPSEPEETKETETVSPVGEEDQRKRQKHVDGRSSSFFLSAGKNLVALKCQEVIQMIWLP